MLKPGNIVEVCEQPLRLPGRWRRAVVDSSPEFDWVCVVGLVGREGSVSVPVANVRLKTDNEPETT